MSIFTIDDVVDSAKQFSIAALAGLFLLANSPIEARTNQSKQDIEQKLSQQKQAAPTENEQIMTEAQIRETFSADYVKKDAESKRALSEKLLERAKNPQNNPTLRYGFYREAALIAAETLDLQKAFGIIETMAASYKMRDLALKNEAFRTAKKNVTSPEQAKIVAESGIAVTEAIFRGDDYVSASLMTGEIKQIPKLPKEIVTKIDDLLADIKQVQNAELAVSAKPDAKSYVILARHSAYRKNNFEEAKDLAQKGNDGDLKTLIESELTNPDTSELQYQLAQKYVDSAKKLKGSEKEMHEKRALHWCGTALTKADDLLRPKIEKMISDFDKGETLSKGLVSRWAFDEGNGTALLDSQKINNGKLNNGAKYAPGMLGTALSLDGIDDYATLGVKDMPAANAQQSMTWWHYVTTNPASGQQCIAVLTNMQDSSVQSGYNNGKIGVWKHGGAPLVSAVPPKAGMWHHYAYTFDGKTHKFHIDGKLQDSSTTEQQKGVPTKFELGRWGRLENGEFFFGGQIDDLRIYSRPVSETEIQSLMKKK